MEDFQSVPSSIIRSKNGSRVVGFHRIQPNLHAHEASFSVDVYLPKRPRRMRLEAWKRKDGRFPLHSVLNNLEQVKSYGVNTDAEKIVFFFLALKGYLRSAEMEAAS